MRSLLLTTCVLLVVAGGGAAQLGVAAPRRPLVFEPIAADQFVGRGGGPITWRFTPGAIAARIGTDTVTLEVVGAAGGGSLRPSEPTGGVSNYYVGRDPSAWRAGVPQFQRLCAADVRPGVDLVCRSIGGELEFDLVTRPHAALRELRLRVRGAGAAHLDADGVIRLGVGGGELRIHAPTVFQEREGARRTVPARFVLEDDTIGFAIGAHDPTLGLTIDPVVTFATLLGGSGTDRVTGCGFDKAGGVLVTGTTTSTDFPLLNPLPIPFNLNLGFVTRFDADGQLVYSTYFGGAGGTTTPIDIGADVDGRAVFGGTTTSPGLPTTAGVVQPVLIDGGDWFFASLDPLGALLWCTYYGGPGSQLGMTGLHVLDVDRGAVVAVGNEAGFPFMTNAYSQVGNVVVAGIRGGNQLFVSTACGFTGTPTGIDATANGHYCITGWTVGANSGLPTTASSFQQFPPSPMATDGFVFVFFGNANSLVWATYVGGAGSDTPRRIRAVSGPGFVQCTIGGETTSPDYPLRHPVQGPSSRLPDTFVTRLNGAGSGLDFSTCLGGSDPGETLRGLDLDAAGNTFVAGTSFSPELPFKNPLALPNSASGRDAFVVRLAASGALEWCTVWGSDNADDVKDLAVAASGDVVVVGTVTGPPNLPVTQNALVTAPGSDEVFVVRLRDETFPSYGAGAPGYWSFVPVLAGGGSGAIGTMAAFNVHRGRAQAPGILLLGAGRTNFAFFGGALLTVPVLTVPLTLRGSRSSVFAERGGGHLHFGIPIPPDPTLRGAVTDWQALFVDAGAAGGISMTNGVEMVVR